jgi:sugar-specific transcriptional regulator TrmB
MEDNLIRSLEVLGFSRLESQVYLTMVKTGPANGYQLAKALGINRSRIYSVMESLHQKGAALLIAGETNEYAAKNPDELLSSLEQKIAGAVKDLRTPLKQLSRSVEGDQYFNLRGKDQILEKTAEIIANSTNEILINTDIPLESLKSQISQAIGRGVRIILFSFYDHKLEDLGIEFYKAKKDFAGERHYCESNSRLMIVADMKEALLAGASTGIFSGLYSRNPLLCTVFAEHLHLDVYFLKTKKHLKKQDFESTLQIQSLMEKSFE